MLTNNNSTQKVNGTALASKKAVQPLIFAIAFAVFFALMFNPLWLQRKKLGSDDASYISHAFTIGLDGDMDYSNEPVIKWATNKKIPAGSIGSGILAAPFVALFSVIDRLIDHPVLDDHANFFGSWSLFGFFFATSIYFLIGVFLYLRSFLLLSSNQKALWLVLLFTLSSGVPHFVLMRFTMSHAFEFFGGALILWASINLYNCIKENGKKVFLWMTVCAIAVAISLFVRQASYNLLILPPLVLLLLYLSESGCESKKMKKKLRHHSMSIMFLVIVSWLPMACYNYYLYGIVFPTSTDMYGHDTYAISSTPTLQIFGELLRRLPRLILVLFSSEWGVFYTNPILVIGGTYIVLLSIRRLIKCRTVTHLIALLGVLVFLGFNAAIVLWWQHTGMCYGYRHLFPLYPMAFFGATLFMNYIDRTSKRNLITKSVIVLCAVSIVSMVFFGATEKLWAKRQVNVFGIMQNSSGKGYMLALPGEVLKPHAWKNIISRRYPGFITKKIAVVTGLDGYLIKVSNKERKLIAAIPGSIYCQSTVVLLIWFVAGYIFGLQKAKMQYQTLMFTKST